MTKTVFVVYCTLVLTLILLFVMLHSFELHSKACMYICCALMEKSAENIAEMSSLFLLLMQ